jgi:tRNA(Arg) A34 adenosine deaminase TadA
MSFPVLQVQLPDWVSTVFSDADRAYATDEERMGLVVDLAARNIAEGTGGPFAAAIYDMDSGRLIAPGVNIVVPARWSGGHAEIVAFAIAQQRLESHDLGAEGMPRCELFSSTEPCAMCLGATPWSGVRRVVCAARDEDARAIGFDEGSKPADWVAQLEARGIEVCRDVLREKSAQVLRAYVDAGGVVYNGRMATD